MSETTQGGDSSGADRLRRTAEEARDAAAERLDDVKDQARDAAGHAQKRASEEAERGKNAGAGQVRQWSQALDRAAAELGSDSSQGELMRQASEGLDDVARSIENRSVGEMVETVADFGRRNPTAFLGGAMLAGFALARFATASRPMPEPQADAGYGAVRAPSTSSTGPSGRATPGHTGGTHTGHAGGAAPGSLSDSAPARPATSPTTPSAGSSEDDEPLTLTGGMRKEDEFGSGTSGSSGPTTAPGTASAPSGMERPYPSAGPVPGTDDKESNR